MDIGFFDLDRTSSIEKRDRTNGECDCKEDDERTELLG